MKSYLDLVRCSAKVHRKQNRMSIICIVLAVFLVTAIFGTADMFVRGQILQAQAEEGNWHIFLRDVSDEDAALLAARPDVAMVSDYSVLNYHGEMGAALSGKDVIICGSSESMVTDVYDTLTEGAFPQKQNEVLVSENARDALGLKIGDSIDVATADGKSFTFVVSGFLKDTAKLMSEDAYGLFLSTDGFRAIYPKGEADSTNNYDTVYFVRFADTGNVQKKISEIKTQFGFTSEQIVENAKLLGLLGQSSNSFMMQIYTAAGILCILVLIAGILMIASSLNSNVTQRTEFFGMIRCIGATPRQVMRLVRREALSWCRFAIPAGVLMGMVVVWILCMILRQLSPEFFSSMPLFGISYPSIAAGIIIGLLTVLLAARAPAKRASKASPLAAVSGNANALRPVKRAANTSFLKIETSLGIHHAKASKKNFILMVSSFSVSIILFLSFSVTVDFMQHALTPLHPWTADLSVVSTDNTCSVDSSFMEQLKQVSGVKAVYGRKFAYDIPVAGNEAQTVDLITYEEKQFAWAADALASGEIKAVEAGNLTALFVNDGNNDWKVGDQVTINTANGQETVTIAGVLSECPFDDRSDVGKLICSEATFETLMGKTDYTIIDIQLLHSATEVDVDKIHEIVGSKYTFSDERLGNNSVRGAYLCFGLCIYGFLVLIALITIFNIVNSLAMSVASRMKQYGAFRAIGLSNHQLKKMILAEAVTYAVTGCICGCAIGLFCHRILFNMLVSFNWGDTWQIPLTKLGVILTVVVVAVMIAVAGPIRKIKEMSIVDTISAW